MTLEITYRYGVYKRTKIITTPDDKLYEACIKYISLYGSVEHSPEGDKIELKSQEDFNTAENMLTQLCIAHKKGLV